MSMLTTKVEKLRAGRSLLSHMPTVSSVQCPTCWLVHSKTDLATDEGICRECKQPVPFERLLKCHSCKMTSHVPRGFECPKCGSLVTELVD